MSRRTTRTIICRWPGAGRGPRLRSQRPADGLSAAALPDRAGPAACGRSATGDVVGHGGAAPGLGAGTVALTYLAAPGRWPRPGRSLAASAVVALDPVLVVQARSVMTETLAAFLLAGALAAPGRRGSRRGGRRRPGLRPGGALPAEPAAAGGAGGARRRSGFGRAGWRTRLGRAAGLVGDDGRRARPLGRAATPVVLASRSGRRPTAATPWPWRTTRSITPRSSTARPARSGPGRDQRRWFDEITPATAGHVRAAGRPPPSSAEALAACSASGPSTSRGRSLARLGRFWGLAPSGAVYPVWLRLATAAWTGPALAGPGAGACRDATSGAGRRSRRRPRVLALTAVHAVYWTDLRMRAPIVPAIALIAAGAALRRGSGDRPDRASKAVAKHAGKKSENSPDF